MLGEERVAEALVGGGGGGSVAQSQFASDLEAAVEVMVAEGWDEEVARQVGREGGESKRQQRSSAPQSGRSSRRGR